MDWHVWQRKPQPDTPFRPLCHGIEEVELQLVHWTGEGADPETECRVVEIRVDRDGRVTVEQSTSYGGDELVSTEQVTRITLPGWEAA